MTAEMRLGDEAESLASAHLEKGGFRVVGRNVRNDGGELDIVAWDGEILVFVEVKGRSGINYGTPVEAVDRRKRDRLTRAAGAYLAGMQTEPMCRFDVVGVDFGGASPRIEHLRDAFRPGE